MPPPPNPHLDGTFFPLCTFFVNAGSLLDELSPTYQTLRHWLVSLGMADPRVPCLWLTHNGLKP